MKILSLPGSGFQHGVDGTRQLLQRVPRGLPPLIVPRGACSASADLGSKFSVRKLSHVFLVHL